MLSQLVFTATLVSSILAQVVPTAPGPGAVFNQGSACPMQFTPDPTGTWTNMSVDLMTGSNTGMVLVANVFSGISGVGGTGALTWTCPAVNPNSAVYFYQFTNNGIDPTWTTRFTIASSSGATTPPTNATQPDGQAIPWGTGRLVGNSTNPGASSSTTSATSTTTTLASTTTTPATTTTSSTSSSASRSSSSSSSPSTTSLAASASASPTKAASASSVLRESGMRLFSLVGLVGVGIVVFA